MKIRSGFVSNSSSSSFCLIVKYSDYASVYKNLSDLEKSILNSVGPETIEAFGLKLQKISYGVGNNSPFEDYSYDGELDAIEEKKMEEEGPSYIIDEIVEKLMKFDNISNTVDC